MATEITEYFDNIELPNYYKDYYKYKKLIKFQGFKINGRANSLCKVGYLDDCNGYLYGEVNFIDNKRNGPYKQYNNLNKNLSEEGIYINNFKNGPYKIYNIINTLCVEGIYENDFKNGTYKVYQGNQIYEEGIYKNDFKNGPYKRYDKNGNIFEGIYINGIKYKERIYEKNL